MVFPFQSASQPPPQQQPPQQNWQQPPPQQQPPQQNWQQPPPPPQQAPPLPDMNVLINGAWVWTAGAQIAQMPPSTQVHHDNVVKELSKVPGYGAAPAQQAPPPPPPPQQSAQPQGNWGNRSAQQPAPGPQQFGGQQNALPGAHIFQGVGKAEIFHKDPPLEQGDYVLRVDEIRWNESNKWTGVLIPTTVLVSSFNAQDPSRQKCNQVGSKAVVFIKKNVTFDRNFKKAIIALSGFDAQGNPRSMDDYVDPGECAAMFQPDQPAAGTLVYVEARIGKTSQDTEYLDVQWWPCKANPDGSPDLSSISR